MTTDKFDLVLARADRVMRQIDERQGAPRDAAVRERQRIMGRYGRALTRATLTVLGLCLATIVFGLFIPIGMFGFLAAVGVAMTIGTMVMILDAGAKGGPRLVSDVSQDLGNAEMVDRFDSFIFRARRALPAPAQAEVDRLGQRLQPLRDTLARVPAEDPDAQDARRLMSTHLPGLVERYLHVPAAYRTEFDAEGKSVDDRLVDALAAGRAALDDISAKLARNDLAAFETQGRFIETRYKDESL
jgi:hypothetical protein